MSRGGRSGAAMRERGSKLPGPKGGPEREEQVTMVVVAVLWLMFLLVGGDVGSIQCWWCLCL